MRLGPRAQASPAMGTGGSGDENDPSLEEKRVTKNPEKKDENDDDDDYDDDHSNSRMGDIF